jgi:hypothetical protein
LIGISINSNAQFFKKLQKKLEQKVEVEQKIDNKIDKVIDKAIDGKNETSETSEKVTLPSVITFTNSIHIEISSSADNQVIKMIALTSDDPEIYGVIATNQEQDNEANVITVVSKKTTTTFIETAGMKIKQTSSSIQIPDDFTKDDNLSENSKFEYQKTGNTKTILGYLCEEYSVNHTIDNQNSSSSFWVANSFSLKNKTVPFLGMYANNPHIKGFVLEFNTKTQNQNTTARVTKIEDKTTKINTNEYKSIGM